MLDTSIKISFEQLLDLAPNHIEYVNFQVFLEPTHKPTTMKMSNGQGRNVCRTPKHKKSVIVGAMDVDRGLLVIAV
jgi:hypothetical protein